MPTLIVLYLAFVALGLPDQMLGIAWPQMRLTFEQKLDGAGFVLALITVFTIISSFLSPIFIKRFSTPTILITSTAFILAGILGFALAPIWAVLLLCCIPYGLGAGTVDAAVNNYAVQNYNTRQINWLHASWGIGASAGPFIMTLALTQTANWRTGYGAQAVLFALLIIVFIKTRHLLTNHAQRPNNTEHTKAGFKDMLKLNPVLSMLFYFLYSAAEGGLGLWCFSYLVDYKGFSIATAGTLVTLYWAALTAGRFLMGFISSHVKTANIITGGLLMALAALILLLFTKSLALNCTALILYGIAISGLYPCMMAIGPQRFGGAVFSYLCGYQIGFASIGMAALPLLIGFIIARFGFSFFIPIIITAICLMFMMDFKLRTTDIHVK